MMHDNNDDIDMVVDKSGKKMSGEIKDIQIDRENYHIHTIKAIFSKLQSDTLSDLLSKTDKRLRDSLLTLMNAAVKNLATALQITPAFAQGLKGTRLNLLTTLM